MFRGGEEVPTTHARRKYEVRGTKYEVAKPGSGVSVVPEFCASYPPAWDVWSRWEGE